MSASLAWPEAVTIREVGPREGFQSHDLVIPTDAKVDCVRHLVEAGFRKINVASLVNPKIMPQVADGETMLAELGPLPGVTVSALTPNARGLDRALELSEQGLLQEVLFVHAMTDSVLKVNGIRDGRDQWRRKVMDLAMRAKSHGLHTVVFISASFGCSIEGPVNQADVIREAELLHENEGVDEVAISDSTGQATPKAVYELFSSYRSELGSLPLTVHFHDSRGAGLANVVALFQAGLSNTTIDASFGGLGGDVPFLPEAAGNIATEDLVAMCESAGIDTGIRLDEVVAASRVAQEAYAGARPFFSRVLALDTSGSEA